MNRFCAEASVKNPMVVNLLVAFVTVMGLMSFLNLRKEAFPPVDYDSATVVTYYRGASADEVERLVTLPLERELKEVDDVDEILSSSDEGISSISVNYSPEATDKKKIFDDIQKAVERVTDLPPDVQDRPFVTEVNSRNIPILIVSLSGNIDEFSMREQSEALKDRFEDVDGVAKVSRTGYRDEEYWVEPDIAKMTAAHISLTELTRAVGAQNVDMPGGKHEVDGIEHIVKVSAQMRTPEAIEDTVIRANDLGGHLKVKDVARVSRRLKEETTKTKAMGATAIQLTIIKKEKGDIIKVVDEVNAVIEAYRKDMPTGLTVKTFDDMSHFVRNRLHVLTKNAMEGFVLVLIVLFMFLPPVPAIMTALCIPTTFFLTFIAMDHYGLTVNLLTMFGLVMALGVVVDNGIVLSENIWRNIENGMPPRQAAIEGTVEVFWPVVAMVMTTIVAFWPLMLMTGLLGKFVKYIPMCVIIALFAALIESLVVLPTHMAEFARAPKRVHKRHEAFNRFRDGYVALLAKVLDHRYLFTLSLVGLLALSVVGAKIVGFQLFGAEGVEEFLIQVQAKPGVSLTATEELIKPLERLVADAGERYVKAYVTDVGYMPSLKGGDPTADKRGSNFAQITVYMTPAQARDKTADRLSAELRERYAPLEPALKDKGLERTTFFVPKDGPPVGHDVDIGVRGDSYETILAIAARVKKRLAELPGVSDIDDTYQLGSEEYRVRIDEAKAQMFGVTNTQIALTLRAAFAGSEAASIKPEKADKQIPILVRLPEVYRNDPAVFSRLTVENDRGQLVSLEKVVSIEKMRVLRSVKHLDGKKIVSVSASVDKKKTSSVEVNAIIKREFVDVAKDHPGYGLVFRGEEKENQKSFASLTKAMGLSFLLIFIILAALFNSMVQPLIIMAPIPLALIGVTIAFLIHGKTFSFLSVMGCIGLQGVIVNTTIVLVDFINKNRAMMGLREAVLEAGRVRLRPILVTNLTSFAGLVTIAYGIGGADPMLKPMALAMCWGLLFATSLKLLFVPALYLMCDDVKHLLKRIVPLR